MKRLILLLFISCAIFFACSENDAPEPVLFAKLKSVAANYMHNRETHSAPHSIGGAAEFVYDKGKLVKRVGGFLRVASGGGYSGIPVDGIYDTVQYTAPDVMTIITKENVEGLEVYPNKREFILEKGLIKQKITYDDISYQAYTDTIHYFYDSQRRLQKTQQGLKHSIVEREYFFDSNGNLQRITGVIKSRYDNHVISTTEELFGGYDDKPNPLKGQCLWQDLLYRTLSTNNFTTYSYKDASISENNRWELVYKEDGSVDYSK